MYRMRENKVQEYGSTREKYRFHNHLTSIVKALENKHTIIDLRNESCVSGLIKFVDGFMNIEMEDVTFYDPQERQHQFKQFYVSSRNIRYVHIPEGLSSMELLLQQMNKLQHQNVKPSKKETFKSKRAKKYQAEIVRSLSEATPGPSTS